MSVNGKKLKPKLSEESLKNNIRFACDNLNAVYRNYIKAEYDYNKQIIFNPDNTITMLNTRVTKEEVEKAKKDFENAHKDFVDLYEHNGIPKDCRNLQ